MSDEQGLIISGKPEHLELVLATASSPTPAGDANLAEAIAADAEFDQLLVVVREPLTKLAVLVHRIRDRALYRLLNFDTFEAYISSKQIQLSRSFIFQLAKVGKMLDTVGIDPIALPEESLEIT
ncbi:MAG: hypothetical protein HY692_04875 [Cyanobacteria bacterium NC_groundwater_1444_Ag_S-0.65um_54_12]|nr:hypothetical protein [Cyanobacteria bacterium NC_groundwater_1444_Ag_S-0.65um_54_12]